MKIDLNLDNNQLNNLCGSLDKNIILIEKYLDVSITSQASNFEIKGENAFIVANILKKLSIESKNIINEESVIFLLKNSSLLKEKTIKLKKVYIKVGNSSQINYISSIDKFDCIFGIGPARTGKTYLAVAKAVEALEQSKISKIILVRPIIEADENLEFLQDDISKKINPYLRSIYDALYEFLGFDEAEKMLSKNEIEVVPLAFMHNRTLNKAFIILDEAQNTTKEQMKIFLTRMGFSSKMIITGDVSRIDIKDPQNSGLLDVINILKDEEQIAFCNFNKGDIFRNNLVKKIIAAYEK